MNGGLVLLTYFVVMLIAAISFGRWQESVDAGVFMFMFMSLFVKTSGVSDDKKC